MVELHILPLLACALCAFLASYYLSYRFSKHVVLADTPNHRSSHHKPTSRAGGLSIIIAWLVSLGLLGALAALGTGHAGGVSAGTLTVSASLSSIIWFVALTVFSSLMGLADDRYSLRPAAKFAGQFLLAILFVMIFGAVSVVPLPFIGMVNIGIFAVPLSLFWIVGMMNAFNFMDGINGLAAGCAALILLVVAIIALAAGIGATGTGSSGSGLVAVPALLLAAGLCGFLPANLIRGSIFMGDGGSQAVGFVLAALGILLPKISGEEGGTLSALLMPVMILPFIADVTFTLVHRFRRGQNVLKAHREHIYQFLFRSGLQHSEVTSIYLAMVALCSAMAVMMVIMAPQWQWLIPVLLSGMFFVFANGVFGKAQDRGFISKPAHPSEVAPAVEDHKRPIVPVRHPAE